MVKHRKGGTQCLMIYSDVTGAADKWCGVEAQSSVVVVQLN